MEISAALGTIRYHGKVADSRMFFSVAVGVPLTFLAGYVGSLAFPGMSLIWLWSLLISIFAGGAKATLALLIVPSRFSGHNSPGQ